MKGHIMILNKENTFTEQNRFLVYSDQLNATRKQILDTAEEMISRSAIQTFEDEGETITATDASYLASLTVDGKAVQDGTPTPEAPVPIGVVEPTNLLPYYEQGSIKSDGTNQPDTNTWHTKRLRTPHIEVNEGATYTVDGTCSLGTIQYGFFFYASNGSSDACLSFEAFSTNTTTTIPSGAKYLRIAVKITGDPVITPSDMNNAQLVRGTFVTPYVPYDCIGLNVGDAVTPINVNSNVLASLPDGTKDVLTVDSAGHCEIEKYTGYIASYDGESVGDNYISTTGELSTGASVYYELATPQIIDLGYISIPAVPDGATISITAQVTPTIAAKWWTKNQSDVAAAFSAVSSDIAALQGEISALDVRVTTLENANAKSPVLEKTEIEKELANEPEEADEQEEMDFEE